MTGRLGHRSFRRTTTLIVATLLVYLVAACSWFRGSEPPPSPSPSAPPAEATAGMQPVEDDWPEMFPEPEPTPEVRGGFPPPEPTPELPPAAPMPVPPPLEVIYFEYDRADIRADMVPLLRANVEWLRDHPEVNILIEGHCDERGSVEYNFALGERRAFTVARFFVDGGVAASRIRTISKGEEEPAVLGGHEQAWARNRRCEFYEIE